MVSLSKNKNPQIPILYSGFFFGGNRVWHKKAPKWLYSQLINYTRGCFSAGNNHKIRRTRHRCKQTALTHFLWSWVLCERAGAVGGGALIAFAPADYKFHKTRPASARVLLLLCRRKGSRPDWEMKLKQTRPCERELLIKEWPLSQRAGSGACSQPAVCCFWALAH